MNDLSFALSSATETAESLNQTLAAQKAALLRDGPPSLAKRIDWLDRCIDLLVEHRREIEDALCADFGWRSKDATALTDVAGSIGPLKHAKANVAKWMKPERRKVSPAALGLFGARAEIRYLPKGVVGVISPWNFPVNLTFAPLAEIIAAGNRAMIKPSELTPATSDLMRAKLAKAFTAEEISVHVGGAEVGQAFSALAFDHLIFTGGTAIGRRVMMAAAQNLVPVTLELGGKSPVIVGRSADMPLAATRIMAGKALNAGQICLAPDYVLAAEEQIDGFVAAAQAAVAKMLPTLRDNPDYTAIISQRHYERVLGYIDDARAKGARIVEINPAGEDFSQQEHRKIAPTLILGATDDMRVMQEEIFGPVLPVRAYKTFSDAIAYVNANERPLGLYYFGQDESEKETVLARTTSGGVTINDVIYHVAQEDLPFGGIGPAGMGRYHGHDGFKEFSHAKGVYTQVKGDLTAMARPPYGAGIRKFLAGQIRK